MFSAIPSPSTSELELGPLDIRLYGLFIALGVVATVLLTRWRLEQRNLDPDAAVILAWAAVPAGLIGARIYHVITDWKTYQDDWGEAFEIWQGGLGIPGGVIAGVLAGALVCRYKNWSLRQIMDVVAPALPLGQAIGRLGNWFNQELFGRPTDLPWGLEIDRQNIPAEYQAEAAVSDITFHPTFLYEALWNVGLIGVLLWIDRRLKLPTGHLFACYVMGYASGRIWIEFIRIDEASELLGVRVNVWVMSVLWLGALAWLLIMRDGTKLDKFGIKTTSGVESSELESSELDSSGLETSELDSSGVETALGLESKVDEAQSVVDETQLKTDKTQSKTDKTQPEVHEAFDFEADLEEILSSPEESTNPENP